ncbi:TetR/AcrR family transcriptional regulator [Paraburkholderia sacchari]|uniref:TetR/AcrR family transcriptional regulator n=1 Tax=Paraburkholderia sacchari TaxID=159450 RepID=UPI00068B9D06|nr:TetR/AcrR family transcriptional regulator [Paraburkholderia sacchari]
MLVERGYRAVSIRQIVALAGVGTGSFYEYYSSKDELAAVCIRLRIRNIAAAMRDCIDAHRNEPLPQRVDALIHAKSAAPLADPEQWSALFVLERRISEMETYREIEWAYPHGNAPKRTRYCTRAARRRAGSAYSAACHASKPGT